MMKALMMTSCNQLEFLDVEMPEVGSDDVLLRIRATGICGSDVHGMDGSTGRRIPPLIMGHEAAGVIEAVGAAVDDFRIGDRVTFDSTIYCGECEYCRSGQINFCENRNVLGVSCDEYSRQGAFAEYVSLPKRILHHLPPDMDFREAAMVEPLSVAVHAVEITPVSLGDTAIVIGAGVIGLLTLQVLRHSGCSRIIVADIDDMRLETAAKLGAGNLVNTRRSSLIDEVMKLTENRGAAVSFDAVGLPETVNSAICSLKKGGTATVIGNLTRDVEIPLQHVVSRQIRLQGSNASSGEYPVCIEMIRSRRVDVSALISGTAPLSEGARWMTKLRDGGSGLFKVILEP